jgi:phospholipid/cholesterol/gamma-HCH transport system permease protein
MATITPSPARAAPPATVQRSPGRLWSLLLEAGELVRFGGQALRALPFSLQYVSEVARHAALMLRGTLPLMAVMTAFIGTSVINFGFFFLRSIGASDAVGLASGYGGPRQLATTMFGYVFTAKICCGIAAELGAMKIQEEIDAMDTIAVDHRRYLVATRLLAALLFTPIAVAIVIVSYTAGCYATAVVLLQGVDPHVFLDTHWSVQSLADWTFVLVLCLVMAMVTAIVGCFYGLRASGGPAGVGSGVARSLYVNLIIVHLLSVCGAVLVYGANLRLPVGG